MTFPKEITRITKGSTTPTHKPKHQLYQPGFNDGNGCWLEGSWITIPEQYFAARKVEHEAMYQGVRSAKQHYRDPSVPPEKMTPAQRQAWQHYSGSGSIYGLSEHGETSSIGIELAGGKIREDSLKWLRDKKFKVIRATKMAAQDAPILRAEDFGIPDDLLMGGQEPIDPYVDIVKQNRKRMNDMSDAYLEMSSTETPIGEGLLSMAGMATQMAFHALIEQEETIIRAEWCLSLGKPEDYTDLAEEILRYVRMRSALKTKFGELFNTHYERVRATHNSCARSNLGESGVLFCFVLPVFHDDGTHEPWGARDVPWGSKP